MGHPVVKWTLNSRSGQRQWTESEAYAVLEDLRTVVWVHYDHQEVEKREEGGNEKAEEEEGRNEDGEEDEGENEEEGGVIASGPAPTEPWTDVDETHGEPGRFPPFQHDETMEHLHQDAEEEEERRNEGEDEGEQEGWNEREEEEEERRNEGEEEGEQEGWNEQDKEEDERGNEGEDEGEKEGWNEQEGEEERGNEQEEGDEAEGSEEDEGDIAAGAAVAAGFGLDGDETQSEAGELPPFSGDETMAHMNHDAQETEPGNQAKREDPIDSREEAILVVQYPMDPPRSYTCGRCSKGIDLDSTFYRCVGHSCRGTFMRQS